MKSVTVYDHVKVIFDNKIIGKPKTPAELWECLQWDIEHDKQAKACSRYVTRQLIMWDRVDLSIAAKGHTLILEAVYA